MNKYRNTLEAFKEELKLLNNHGFRSVDEQVALELPTLFMIEKMSEDQSLCKLDESCFTSNFDYSQIYPSGNEQMQIELNYYNNVLTLKLVDDIVNHLKQYPNSRRAVFNFWDKSYEDPKVGAACLVYLYFRQTSQGLDMHACMRANNAFRISLMNFHIYGSIHREVCKKLGVEMGNYYHFADSYHVYNKDLEEMNEFLSKL